MGGRIGDSEMLENEVLGGNGFSEIVVVVGVGNGVNIGMIESGFGSEIVVVWAPASC